MMPILDLKSYLVRGLNVAGFERVKKKERINALERRDFFKVRTISLSNLTDELNLKLSLQN